VRPRQRSHRPDAPAEVHPPAGTEDTADPSLSRVEAFSDGVFAFAITLLILAIRIPHPTDRDAGAGVLTLLTQQWRSYLASVLSFMIAGINWANHRVMFSKFARANHALIWLNLLYLMMGVAFIPVQTAVLGEWLGSPRNEVVAAVFYGGVGTVGALLFDCLWRYGAYAARLTSPELSARARRAYTIAWAPAPFVIAAFTAVVFANPGLAVAGYVATVDSISCLHRGWWRWRSGCAARGQAIVTDLGVSRALRRHWRFTFRCTSRVCSVAGAPKTRRFSHPYAHAASEVERGRWAATSGGEAIAQSAIYLAS
jgi:uncharacterized membrane protein